MTQTEIQKEKTMKKKIITNDNSNKIYLLILLAAQLIGFLLGVLIAYLTS